MKRFNELLVIITLSLFSYQVNAQDYQVMSLGLDPELIIDGAYDDDNTPVLHAHFSWVSKLENKNEIGIKVSFANLKYRYFDYGFIYNHNINLLKSNMFETLIGTKVGLIHRSYPEFYSKKLYLNYELNAQARIWISKEFGFYTKINFGPRHDLDYYGNHKAISYEVEIGTVFKF